jgi:hypothetical protein
MRLAIGIGAVLAMLLPDAPAQAGFNPARVIYPWCLAHSDRSGWFECAFYTFQQCLDTRWGVGGSCQPNPRYYAERPTLKQDHYRR